MAEALLKRLAADHIYVDSCGLHSPKGRPDHGHEGLDPFAIQVMEEIGHDLGGHRPKTFDELDDESFDLIVSLTPQAQHRAVEMTRGRAAEIEYWPTFDPTLVEGGREARLEAYRTVRDALAAQIKRRFADIVVAGASRA